jgi:hypothetical protein
LNLPDTYIIKKKKLTEKEQSSRTISKDNLLYIKKKKLIGQEQSPRTISDTSRRRRRRRRIPLDKMQQNRREEMREHLQGKCATMFSFPQCSKKLLLLLLLLQRFLSRQRRSFALFAPCLHQRSHSLHYRENFQNFSNPLPVGHA